MMRRFKNKDWYNNAIVVCTGVLFYVILVNFPHLFNALKTFIGYFSPVILGCVIAYIVNPLSVFLKKKLFPRAKGNVISNILAFLIVILFIVFFLAILIPQLIDSLSLFSSSLPDYASSAEETLHNFGIKWLEKYIHNTFSSSEKLISAISSYVKNNTESVLATSAVAGKYVINFFIAFLLSFYLIGEKARIKAGLVNLLKVLSPESKYHERIIFFRKCNAILNRYIIFNLLDSFIIGIANAILMLIFGLPYIGLVSFIIALTNLIPTFGPLFGGAVGAFILMLDRPLYAIIFLAITAVLQIIDAYLLKPKLFGNSLGVSGLWILIGIIVGGRMFGVTGILLAIPVVAILDLVYREYAFPLLERRAAARVPEEEQRKTRSSENYH